MKIELLFFESDMHDTTPTHLGKRLRTLETHKNAALPPSEKFSSKILFLGGTGRFVKRFIVCSRRLTLTKVAVW
jgi:hypothetical protein